VKALLITVMLLVTGPSWARTCFNMGDIISGAATKGNMLIEMHQEHIRILERLNIIGATNYVDEDIQWFLEYSPAYPLAKIISFKDGCGLKQWIIPAEELRVLSGKMT